MTTSVIALPESQPETLSVNDLAGQLCSKIYTEIVGWSQEEIKSLIGQVGKSKADEEKLLVLMSQSCREGKLKEAIGYSFLVSATATRIGDDDRSTTAEELARLRGVARAIQESGLVIGAEVGDKVKAILNECDTFFGKHQTVRHDGGNGALDFPEMMRIGQY